MPTARRSSAAEGRTLRAVACVVLLIGAGVAERGAAQPCAGVAEETPQRLAARLKAVAVAEAYRFESLTTRESTMTILWSRDGRPCPAIAIEVANCGSPLGLPVFRLSVPPRLSTECPGLEPIVRELADAVRDEKPIGPNQSLPPHVEPWLWVAVAIAGAAGWAILRLIDARVRPRIGWGDAVWVAFVAALALLLQRNLVLNVDLLLGTGWFALGLLLLDRRLLAIDDRRTALSLLALFVGALLVRAASSSSGPGDLHLNLAHIWSNELDLRWGPAPVAGFRLLRLLLGEVDGTAIVWCNLVAGSLVPILVYATLAQLGIARPAALLGAAAVAGHPIAILFSGVLGRQPAYLFAAFGALLALIGFLEHGSGRYLPAFVLAAVLAATTRPEGAQVLIPMGAAILFVPSDARKRAAAGIAILLLGAGAFLYVAVALPPRPPRSMSSVGALPFLWTILCRAEYTPAAWIAAWVLGLVAGVRARAAWIAIVTLVGLDLLWRWTDLYQTIVGIEGHVAATRYQTILLAPFAIGAALLAQRLGRAPAVPKWSAAAALAAATVVTFREPYETLLRPFTVDHEYRFLARYARSLPAGSRLYVLDPPFDDMGFIDARLVGDFVRSPIRFAPWSERRCEQPSEAAGGDYLYIGSVCSEVLDAPGRPLIHPAYERWLAECESIRQRVRGGALEEVDVPARKMSWHDFREPRARLGIYRLTDPSLCALGWRARFHQGER